MALAEVTQIDQIVINPVTGTVTWRLTTFIIKDGLEIVAQHFFRGSRDINAPAPPEWPAYLDAFRAIVDTPAAQALAAAAAQRAQDATLPGPHPPAPLPTNFP